MTNYFADDANYEADLEAAYEVIGLPDWWNDTEQDDIKLVALYRLRLIEKLEAKLAELKKATNYPTLDMIINR